MGGACICSLYKMTLEGALSYVAYTGTCYGEGMVFGFSVLIRVNNFMPVYTKQCTVT